MSKGREKVKRVEKQVIEDVCLIARNAIDRIGELERRPIRNRLWVGLTGPEVDEAYRSVSDKEWAIGGLADARVFFCAIEAKLKEKNT